MSTASAVTRSRAGHLGRCIVCSKELPLRAPRANEAAEPWQCAGCGTTYPAVWWEAAPQSIRDNAKRAEADSTSRSLEALKSFSPAEPSYRPLGKAKTAPPPRTGICCPVQTALTRWFDDVIDRGAAMQVERSANALMDRVAKHGARPYDLELARDWAAKAAVAADAVDGLFKGLANGQPVDVALAERLVKPAFERLATDIDLFAALALCGAPPGNLGRHSVQFTMLAIVIGTALGWDEPTLTQLGVGCLLHDAGMLCVAPDLYSGERLLDNDDFVEITKHPVYTFNLLVQHVDKVPLSSRLAAYQLHERCDGSGYPRGRKSDQIHDFAKVAAVADTMVALASPRPHRPGLMPYYAIESLLQATRRGLFDPVAVRGLLRVVSLFPLGSYVQLNDGRAAKIIRSNGDQYTRPVIEVVGAGSASEIINLAAAESLAVAQALAEPPAA